MKKSSKLLVMFFVALQLHFFLPLVNAETKLFQVHFVAASFAYRSDGLPNSNLSVISGSSGYDAVWETRVDESVEFPTSFGSPSMRNVKGHTQQTVKDLLLGGNCDADLALNPNPANYPSVNVYSISKTKYAVKIIAPHSLGPVLQNSNAPFPCNAPFSIFYAPAPGVTEDYQPKELLPNDPNTPGSPPSRQTFAAFEVDLKHPEGTHSFYYVQEANLTDVKEKSKTVWFGTVTIEVDPARNDRTPPPVDPYTLFSYSPPSAGQEPANPPDLSAPPSTPPDKNAIGQWLGGNIISQIQETLQNIRAALSGARSLRTAPVIQGDGYIYDPTNGQLVISAIAAAPAAGTLGIKAMIGNGDVAAKNLAKKVAIESQSTSSLTLILPKSLRSALTKKGKTKVRLIGEFKPTSIKLISKRSAFTLK